MRGLLGGGREVAAHGWRWRVAPLRSSRAAPRSPHRRVRWRACAPDRPRWWRSTAPPWAKDASCGNSAASASIAWVSSRGVTRCDRLSSGRAPSASRARSRASATPRALSGVAMVSSRQAAQVPASATRWPARLPLSTVETYGGSRGRRSAVPYQLKKWPRNFFMTCMVASVASMRSTASIRPSQPNSRAQAVDSSSSPRLVGEVRRARTGAGSSWKLSGGSM